jgi:MFS family permease
MTFALLFSLESLVRSLNSTVLSLQAYELLGSGQAVSILSTAVSLCVLVTTLLMPYVLGRVRRRYAYTAGALCMIAASLALASFTVPGQMLGAYLRNFGAAVLNVTLSLYILDHIRKADLARTEPLRMSFSTLSWMAGPAAGVWFYDRYGPAGAQAVAIVCAVVLLAVFWALRLSDARTLPSGTMTSFNPLANVRRFASQPRLLLAWTIAFGRSCYWATFFIYGPLLVVEGNLSKQTAGLMISASQFLLLASWLFGKWALRAGVRPIIGLCFLVMSFAAIGGGLAGSQRPYAAIGLLLVGSLAAVGVDAVGGIPFLRAVRYHERQRMAAVYRTFIDFSELIPGMIFAIALQYFEVPVVFVILGFGMLATALISWRYLPKSM